VDRTGARREEETKQKSNPRLPSLRSDAHLPCPSLSCSYPPPSSARRLSPQGFSFSSSSQTGDGPDGDRDKRWCDLVGHTPPPRAGRERERERATEGGRAAAPVSRPPAMALPAPPVRLALLLLVALPFCAAHPGPGAFNAPRHFQTPALHSGSCSPTSRVSSSHITLCLFSLWCIVYIRR
jgi:hypothetical protein